MESILGAATRKLHPLNEFNFFMGCLAGCEADNALGRVRGIP